MIMTASSADLKTQSQMMRTCSTLRHEGARVILKERNIDGTEDTKIDSFLLFMRADEGIRYSYLHSLTVVLVHPAKNHRRALSDLFLQLAAHSTFKSLRFLEDYGLLADPHSNNAVMQIGSIKDLHISSAGTQASDILRNSRSQFQRVFLVCQ